MRVHRISASIALVVAVVVTAGNGPPVANAAARPVGAANSTSVTLVTGDRVVLATPDTGGVRVVSGPGRKGVRFSVSTEHGHLYVIPGDALALVGSGRVDRRLFDVTALRDAGYDDARRTDVPLIAQYDKSVREPSAPPLARRVRALPGLHAAVLRAPKRSAAEFWNRLTGRRGTPAELAGGLTHLWLDGVRRPTLDVSVPQIGAPAAWRAGFTGQGVTVAVLDTGIDATHPDLAGQVAAAQDFTGGAQAGDPVGHGTHIASTIAGTGAASGGRYRGVASGAKLLDGKVCQPDPAGGVCYDSAVLAGMQWAAEQGARVVNMSFGQPDFPGVDVVEDAVNRLSGQYNT